MSGFSGMIAFVLQEGSDSRKVVESTTLFALAESPGASDP